MKIILLIPLLLASTACHFHGEIKDTVSKTDYNSAKKDYQDARQNYQQCQQQTTTLKKEIQSCQRYLKLYKNNQENYKKLPDKGFN